MFTKKITFTIFSAFISTGIFAQTIQEGVKALQMENYVGALKIFESIISKEPTNGLAYYYAGDTKFTTGDIGGAKSSFKKGSEMAPKEGPNFCRFGFNSNGRK
ncbi:MAG: tetratricopeptide repeat protein [Bacteroidetes bacterium]|nr:tetratricopeptide repeat protein [Bacteroidota bacterium]